MQLALKIDGEFNHFTRRKIARPARKDMQESRESITEGESIESEDEDVSAADMILEDDYSSGTTHRLAAQPAKRKIQASHQQFSNVEEDSEIEEGISDTDSVDIFSSEHSEYENSSVVFYDIPGRAISVEDDDGTVTERGYGAHDDDDANQAEYDGTVSDAGTGSTTLPAEWAEQEDESVVDCKCGNNVDDGRTMICCDHCDSWQHSECNSLPEGGNVDGIYLCPTCDFKVVSLIQLQDNVPKVYTLTKSPLKKYVPIWRTRGRTDLREDDLLQMMVRK